MDNEELLKRFRDWLEERLGDSFYSTVSPDGTSTEKPLMPKLDMDGFVDVIRSFAGVIAPSPLCKSNIRQLKEFRKKSGLVRRNVAFGLESFAEFLRHMRFSRRLSTKTVGN
jgi:hypothetical protein